MFAVLLLLLCAAAAASAAAAADVLLSFIFKQNHSLLHFCFCYYETVVFNSNIYNMQNCTRLLKSANCGNKNKQT